MNSRVAGFCHLFGRFFVELQFNDFSRALGNFIMKYFNIRAINNFSVNYFSSKNYFKIFPGHFFCFKNRHDLEFSDCCFNYFRRQERGGLIFYFFGKLIYDGVGNYFYFFLLGEFID